MRSSVWTRVRWLLLMLAYFVFAAIVLASTTWTAESVFGWGLGKSGDRHPQQQQQQQQFGDRSSCGALLSQGDSLTNGNQWRHEDICRMYQYHKSDIAECMIRSERVRTRRNLFVFIGDSRMREQHQSFIDVAARKPYRKLTGKLCCHSSSNFSDDFFDVEFVWNTRLQAFPRLRDWLENPPVFVVVGVGLWHLMRSGADLPTGLGEFKAALKAMLPTFEQLGKVTKVIWMPNGPVLREFVHSTGCLGQKSYLVAERNKTACAHQWKRSDWIRIYNEAAYDILTSDSRSIYIWTAAKRISEMFVFDMVDSVHLMADCKLPGSHAMYLRSQMLLNFHCNRFM